MAYSKNTGQDGNKGFRGQMAFVNVFNRPLSASDVAYLYANPSYNVSLNPDRGLLTIGIENETGTINNDRIVLWPGAGNGSVGINNRTPVSTLDVSGTLNVSGTVRIGTDLSGVAIQAGNIFATGLIQGQRFNSTSDYRVKSDIQDLDASYTVDTLRPVTYKFASNGLHDIGFIAHEVQSQYPFLVQGEKDGPITQSLNYNGIIGILTKELKELKAVVRELKDTVVNLNNTVLEQDALIQSLIKKD